jgi:hypothetical protein
VKLCIYCMGHVGGLFYLGKPPTMNNISQTSTKHKNAFLPVLRLAWSYMGLLLLVALHWKTCNEIVKGDSARK